MSIDFSGVKAISVPEGSVSRILWGSTVLWKKPSSYTNLVPLSTDTDGSIYNGCGYKENVRLSSSGGISSSAQNGSVTTGFIPFHGDGDIVRMKGAEWVGASNTYGGHFYWGVYDSNKTKLGCLASSSYSGGTYGTGITYDETIGVTTFDMSAMSTAFQEACASAAYFRISAYGSGADLIITVNQEITE